MGIHMTQPSPSSPDEPAFEEILVRLQQIVERLEGGDLALEESLAVFEEGVRLSRMGARRLDDAERKVEVLLNDDNELRTKPLELRDDPKGQTT